MADIVRDFWHLILAVIALVGWAVRTEAGMISNRQRIDRLEKQLEKDFERFDKQQEMVKHTLELIQGDIKQILILMNNKADR